MGVRETYVFLKNNLLFSIKIIVNEQTPKNLDITFKVTPENGHLKSYAEIAALQD